jgi:hypothetical protein
MNSCKCWHPEENDHNPVCPLYGIKPTPVYPARWKPEDFRDRDILLGSIWDFPTGERDGLPDHHGCFIPQIPRQLIRRYTEPGDWVLDPFCGSGTTLSEALTLGRHSLNTDLSHEAIEKTNSVAQRLCYDHPGVHGCFRRADARQLERWECEAPDGFQLAILHPPYHSIIKFSDEVGDMSSQPDLESFLRLLGLVGLRTFDMMRVGGYVVLMMGDIYRDSAWVPLSYMAMQAVQQAINISKKDRLVLKGIVQKNIIGNRGKRGKENLWRNRALRAGSFLMQNETLFVFKKVRP